LAPKKQSLPPLSLPGGLGRLLPTAVPTPVPAVFDLQPSTKTLKVGETLSLALSLSSGAFTVDAVDAILVFDPAVFKAEKITAGKLFTTYPIKQYDNKTGQVQLSAVGKIKEGKVVGFSGQGEYGTVVFRALKAADFSKISLDSNSIVASAGQNRLDLEKSGEGSYQILPK
jgi:hypothetical protein